MRRVQFANMLGYRYQFIIVLFALAFGDQARSQSFEPTLTYVHVRPTGQMAEAMHPAHGIQLELRYRLPNEKMSMGLGFANTWYDRFREDINVMLGTSTFDTPLIVNHRLTTATGVIQFDFIEAGPLQPYVGVRGHAGAFVSRLQIRDPEYTENGEGPLNLVEDRLFSSPAFFGGPLAGLRLDLGMFISGVRNNTLQFCAEVGWLYGSKVEYAFSFTPADRSARQAALQGGTLQYELIETEYHDLRKFQSSLSLFSFQAAFVYRINT